MTQANTTSIAIAQDGTPVRHWHPGSFAIPTAKLITLLKDGKPGDEFTDEKTTEICGHDTSPKGDGKGYSYLLRAIKHCGLQHSTWWRRVRKEGKIRCLNPAERLAYGKDDIRSVGRRARRATVKLAQIGDDELNDQERNSRNVHLALAGTIAAASNRRTATRLLAQGAKVSELDMPKLLEMLVKK